MAFRNIYATQNVGLGGLHIYIYDNDTPTKPLIIIPYNHQPTVVLNSAHICCVSSNEFPPPPCLTGHLPALVEAIGKFGIFEELKTSDRFWGTKGEDPQAHLGSSD